MDSISGTVGNETSGVAIGKGINQEHQQATVSPIITNSILPNSGDPIATILFYVANQNTLIATLTSKIDNHITRVDDRFRGLEGQASKLESAVGLITNKLQVIEKTNAELEHASNYRGSQTNKLQEELTELKRQTDEIKKEIQGMRTESKNNSNNPPYNQMVGYVVFSLLPLCIALIIWFGFYFLQGGK